MCASVGETANALLAIYEAKPDAGAENGIQGLTGPSDLDLADLDMDVLDVGHVSELLPRGAGRYIIGSMIVKSVCRRAMLSLSPM